MIQIREERFLTIVRDFSCFPFSGGCATQVSYLPIYCDLHSIYSICGMYTIYTIHYLYTDVS